MSEGRLLMAGSLWQKLMEGIMLPDQPRPQRLVHTSGKLSMKSPTCHDKALQTWKAIALTCTASTEL
eukprot:1154842-Pelagomonas_calceolata.AAC.2